MKLLLVFVSCLLVPFVKGRNSAPLPPRPTPYATFNASGEVEHHLPEETRFGTCETGVHKP